MRSFLFFLSLINFLITKQSHSQVLTWSSAARTGSTPTYTYTGSGINAVITTNAVTMGDGTPRVDNLSGFSACYSGLALYTAFFNSYLSATNSHVTVTFSFAGGYGCSDVTLILKDINSEETSTTFCDVVELSGTYGNAGTALPTANITTTLASNVTRLNATATLVNLVGHNSSSELIGSYSTGTACGNTTIKFAAPAGSPLKTFTIKYRPARGTSTANAYYNTNPSPAAQYISVGNLSFVATSGCTVLLPIELVSFNAKRTNEGVYLDWKTASEKNNDCFSIERSLDGFNFEEIKKIKSAGDSYKIINYEIIDENATNDILYYRLKQTDYNGQYKYSEIVSVDAYNTKCFIGNVFPNPTSSNVEIDFYTPLKGELNYDILDYTGRVLLSKTQIMESGHSKLNAITDELPSGLYFLNVFFNKTHLTLVHNIFKN